MVPEEERDPTEERKIRKVQAFTIWELRSVVRYLHSQAFNSTEIHEHLNTACREGNAPSFTEVKCWIHDLEEIKEDGETVASASAGSRTGPGLDTPTDPALVARIETLLINDRRISVERAASMACVNNITAAAVINNVLGLKKVCARWVPRLWTPEQRAFRASVCGELMKIYEENGSDWLDRLIVGDEGFVMYYCPEHVGPMPKKKSPNRADKDPGNKYKPTIEPKRAYCLFFYDAKGFLAAELLNTSHPPDAVEYIRIIKENLVPAIRRRRKMSEKSFFLLQDPTPSHSSLATKRTLKELGITTLPHAPASPDLEPHEYWLFRNLFKKVDGLNFRSVADLWKKVQRTIFQHSDVDFNRSIKSLPDRWRICIERQGEVLADL